MDNLVKASQKTPLASSDEEHGEEVWDQHDDVQVLRRSVGGKRPRYMLPHNQEDVEVMDQPDLAEYFAQWEISEKDQILMCRAYASYLAVKKNRFQNK